MPAEVSPTMRLVRSPFTDQVLSKHVCQGRSNDCGPYSAAMVINSLSNQAVDPNQLARDLEKIHWFGPFPLIRRIPQWATFPWGVADALRQRGIRAYWKPFGTRAGLLNALNNGKIPVVFIGSYKPLWGHVIVLLARDPQKGWGFADPAWATAELHWIPDATFRAQWLAYANSWVEVESISKVTGQ